MAVFTLSVVYVAAAGLQPAQSPRHCTKCNVPPVNDQCTNHCISSV